MTRPIRAQNASQQSGICLVVMRTAAALSVTVGIGCLEWYNIDRIVSVQHIIHQQVMSRLDGYRTLTHGYIQFASFGFDPFETLAVIDYGDASFDYTQPQGFAETIAAQAGEIIKGEAQLFSLGGDHFVTYPLLKAHAARLRR